MAPAWLIEPGCEQAHDSDAYHRDGADDGFEVEG